MSLVLDCGSPSGRSLPAHMPFYINWDHRLLKLMLALDWSQLINIVLPDLKKTAGLFWFLGRKLHIRIHLGAYILQCFLKMTDRETEERIVDSPVYQIFCGLGFLKHFYIPDHTKIEDFRNRLSSETHQALVLAIIKLAGVYGFTSFETLDIDSTVQEAGITYPSDATLLKALGIKAHQALAFLQNTFGGAFQSLSINLAGICSAARSYFFRAKNLPIEKARKHFSDFYQVVKSQVVPLIQALQRMDLNQFQALPWNIRNKVHFLVMEAAKYFKDVAFFIRTHTIKKGKLLSFHLREVACITKGKLGKQHEFGRVWQLGRLLGNFIIPFLCRNVTMNDKNSLIPIIQEYSEIFGEGTLKEISTDKGYYSKKNVETPKTKDISTDGIQRPTNSKNQPTGKQVEELKRRRAGIEPLIGHVKSFGLRKSRMKSDKGVLASGYRSVLGFNLHQLARKLAS